MKLNFENTLYEHANLKQNTTGQPFELWLDEFGKDRKVQHNEPRFKVKANNIELDCILHSDDTIEIINNNKDIQKFKYAKQAKDFIYVYRNLLRMHWNHDVDTGDVAIVMKMLKSKKVTTEDILDMLSKVKNDDLL